MNLREWRHFFRLRADAAAHPQCREVARMLLERFAGDYPVFFTDLREADSQHSGKGAGAPFQLRRL